MKRLQRGKTEEVTEFEEVDIKTGEITLRKPYDQRYEDYCNYVTQEVKELREEPELPSPASS